MNQKKIIKMIRKVIGRKNVIVMNAGTKSHIGMPDILVNYHGHAFFIEIKIMPDKPSKLQQIFLERFNRSSEVLYFDKKDQYFFWKSVIINEKLRELMRILTAEMNDSLHS